MTIQDAIKSGKPFKRPEWTEYMVAPNDGLLEFEPKGKRKYGRIVRYLTRKTILATDWEVKE